MNDDDAPSLGPCCGCERDTAGSVHTIVMLEFRNKVPGHGWGCFVCNLPCDGASAVLCDDCREKLEHGVEVIRFGCRGYPGTDGRAPIETFNEPFMHDTTIDHR